MTSINVDKRVEYRNYPSFITTRQVGLDDKLT